MRFLEQIRYWKMLFLYQIIKGKIILGLLTHALMSIGFLLAIYLWEEKKLLLAQLSLINSFVYFMADLFVWSNPSKIFHHLICGLCCIIGLSLSPEITVFTAKLCGLIETSNPLWAFLRIRLENFDEIPLPSWYTKLIAGGVFTLVFFIVRFLWFPLVLYYEIPDGIPLICYHITLTPFYLLNLYWLIILIREFFKELTKKAPVVKKRKPRYCD